MGLDWQPTFRPKPGHEAEFEKIYRHFYEHAPIDVPRRKKWSPPCFIVCFIYDCEPLQLHRGTVRKLCDQSQLPAHSFDIGSQGREHQIAAPFQP